MILVLLKKLPVIIFSLQASKMMESQQKNVIRALSYKSSHIENISYSVHLMCRQQDSFQMGLIYFRCYPPSLRFVSINENYS